jgi:spermidine synthase
MAVRAARIHENARERIMVPNGAAGGERVMILGGGRCGTSRSKSRS